MNSFTSRVKSFLARHKVLQAFMIIVVIAIPLHIALESSWRPEDKSIYGVSFSIPVVEDYGLDWKENFLALNDDLKIKRYRLMSYWDDIEPEDDNFYFDDLDWQFDVAERRGHKINLVLGHRQPRWPECYQPSWADNLEADEWDQELFEFMEAVINRYKDSPALLYWQLENEALNKHFGDCPPADKNRLQEEYDLIKTLDTNHPVMMSVSDQHGLPLGKPKPDIYGFSVYRVFYNNIQGPSGYITYPTPIWYHKARAALIRGIHSKPVIIHELQMEPWGPKPTPELSIDEQNISASPAQLAKNFEFARKLHLDEMYLWGGEWWFARLKAGDETVWETVRAELYN